MGGADCQQLFNAAIIDQDCTAASGCISAVERSKEAPVCFVPELPASCHDVVAPSEAGGGCHIWRAHVRIIQICGRKRWERERCHWWPQMRLKCHQPHTCREHYAVHTFVS